MHFSHEDTRGLPKDQSWGLGIWYYGWDESAINVMFGYHSFGVTWQRRRPKARDAWERMVRWLKDPAWGIGYYRDNAGEWSVDLGPWRWEDSR